MGSVISLDAVRRRRSRDRRVGGERVRTSFYFDLADPGTYLAAERIDLLFPGVTWVPASAEALLSGLGRAAAPAPAERASIAERATALNMPLVWPDTHPEPRPVAMRAAAHACAEGRGGAFVLAASRLAFCGGFDLDDPEVLAEAAAAAGLALDPALAAAGETTRDAAIIRAGRALVARGADAMPVLRVGRLLFAGEHRIPEAAAALRGGDGRRVHELG